MRAQTGAGTFLAVVAVAWSVVRCGAPGATQAVAAGDDSGGTTTGPGGSGPDSGGGQSTPDAGAAEADSGASPGSGDADASQCPVACTGTTPVCDQGTCVTCTDTAGCSGNTPVCNTDADGGVGQCVQVQILAFELTDAQMVDRAHAAYQRHANAWFPQTGMDEGFFTFTVTNDWDQLATIQPQKGLIVMFVDISPADVALSGPNQSAIQAGFQSYMENGGAWFGSHYSGYNDNSGSWNWPWYFDTFIGTGFYVMNTWEPVSINVDVDDPTHPVSQGLGSMFTTAPSEWYSWTNDLRTMPNIDILLSVDPSSFPVGTDPTQSWTSGYYPIAWTNTNYKMMYLNAGHELMDYTTDTGLSERVHQPHAEPDVRECVQVAGRRAAIGRRTGQRIRQRRWTSSLRPQRGRWHVGRLRADGRRMRRRDMLVALVWLFLHPHVRAAAERVRGVPDVGERGHRRVLLPRADLPPQFVVRRGVYRRGTGRSLFVQHRNACAHVHHERFAERLRDRGGTRGRGRRGLVLPVDAQLGAQRADRARRRSRRSCRRQPSDSNR